MCMKFKLWIETNEAHLRQLVPNWPEYVFKDLLFSEHNPTDWQEKYLTEIFPKRYGVAANEVQWRLEEVFIHPRVLEPDSKTMLLARLAGAKHDVGNDAERTNWQKDRTAREGISKQPLIVVKRPQGLELLEGWHRVLGTMALDEYKNGYKAPAYTFDAKR